MAEDIVKNIDDLHQLLDAAIQLEHATIPPYLTALYSLYPNSNIEASQIIRAVLVEEMLHMTLAANLLNAIGYCPKLLAKGFVPNFPTTLPSGETDFEVSIAPFTKATLQTFLNIERPSKPSNQKECALKGCVQRPKDKTQKMSQLWAATPKQDDLTYSFYSIGDFYQAILDGFNKLEGEAQDQGKTIFTGNIEHQITNEYYYSGGGGVIVVHDLATACEAIELIMGQGEGFDQGIFDQQGEIAHYYRFKQLELGQFYHPGDRPDMPTGEKFEVDWDAVYPVIENPKLAHFKNSAQLYGAAELFNDDYKAFLEILQRAFSGERTLLLNAVCGMFRLKDYATQLIRNPIASGGDHNGGPTFEIDQARANQTFEQQVTQSPIQSVPKEATCE